MTDKMKMFVSEYLKDFNATQAAIRAGYSEDTARQMGSENLSKPDIRKAIDQYIETIECNKDKIVVENVRLWHDMKDNPEYPEQARLKASELLGKYAAMFTDKIEHSGEIDSTVTTREEKRNRIKELLNKKEEGK